MMKDANNAVVM